MAFVTSSALTMWSFGPRWPVDWCRLQTIRARVKPASPALAARTGRQVAQLLGLAKAPPLRSVGAAQRPMTSDGRPLCGYVEGIDGLFALVAHPCVILAPFLGRRCAQSVLGA